ncbi:acyltransferase [Leucobacter weissii]|uniref:Acyltransferase n=1 Tax=Leucobacter weissii TaxID=1983706 RepID=A0A939S751_9MICO|nr:acyltransferase family protein [Leucobacter weissii]MBO1900611.1 acyltransferase [Leucobacter weissii]
MSRTAVSDGARKRTRPPRSRSAYMHEIDGVRGIALTLVVLFHVFGNGRVSGGVDVFLVLSAFFLTRKLLGYLDGAAPAASPRERRGWLGAHYLRVATRLLPSAMIVLAGVLVATWLWTPVTRHAQTLAEVLASALYYENWELIFSQLGYEAAGPASSPLQHFWSLSVQGQFFIVWPLLAFALFAILRRSRPGLRGAFLAVTALATAASFAWAVSLVSVDQEVAYFDSFSRFWELGAGALMAFVPGRLAARPWVRETLTWVGLAMIVASGFLFDGASVFPGIPTLWPVLATALVLFGASREVAAGFSSAVLSTAPVRFLARIAYQLYLWHWPVLIFYIQHRGHDAVGWRGALVVLGASVVLAVLTERVTSAALLSRLAGRGALRAIAVPLVPLLLVAGTAVWWGAAVRAAGQGSDGTGPELSAAHVGALALTDPDPTEFAGAGGSVTGSTNDPDVEFLPRLEAAYLDRAAIYRQGCVQTNREEPGSEQVLVCDNDHYGDRRTIVLTGGSYAAQWHPALREIAEQQGWRLVVIEKNGCRLRSDSTRADCAEWNRNVIPVIASYEPDAVITLGTGIQLNRESPERIMQAELDPIRELGELGIPVIGIRATPKFPFVVPDCLAEHDNDIAACSYPRAEIFDPHIFEGQGLELPDNLSFVDLSDGLCGPTLCEPVVGNVLVYRDAGHMTATYAATLAPALEAAMREAAPQLF